VDTNYQLPFAQKKEMDFEFECQFAYITSEGEQQSTASSVASGATSVVAAVASVATIGNNDGNDAKRLKQE